MEMFGHILEIFEVLSLKEDTHVHADISTDTVTRAVLVYDLYSQIYIALFHALLPAAVRRTRIFEVHLIG